MLNLLHLFTQLFIGLFSSLEQAFLHLTQPSRHSVVLSPVADLTRSKADLIAENALLRQQLVVLYRQIKKPALLRNPIASGLSCSPVALRTGRNPSSSSNPTRSSAGIGKTFGCFGNSNRVTAVVVPN